LRQERIGREQFRVPRDRRQAGNRALMFALDVMKISSLRLMSVTNSA
jgi:hypothetical protein